MGPTRRWAGGLVVWIALAGVVHAAARPPVGERTIRIGARRVKERGAPFGGLAYLTPNERGDVLGEAIHGKAVSGDVIGVGSVRSTQTAVDATAGLERVPAGFRAYQLDVEPRIVTFNLGSRRVLARSAPTAEAYVAQHPSISLHGYTGPTSGHNFLTDRSQYARAVTLARRRALVPIAGSVTGATLHELGRAIAARGRKVSVLDLSNVLAYTGPDPGLIANLRALPWSDDAVVLLTADHDNFARSPQLPSYGGWWYVAIPARELLATIERGWWDSRRRLGELHVQMIDGSRAARRWPREHQQLLHVEPGFAAALPAPP